MFRTQGDIVRQSGQAYVPAEADPESYASSLRPTGAGQALRETGQLLGQSASAGQLMQPGDLQQLEAEEKERRSVRSLVQRFRAKEAQPGDLIPAPYQPNQFRRQPVPMRAKPQQPQMQQPQQQQQRSFEEPAMGQQQPHPAMQAARNRSSMMVDSLNFESVDSTHHTGFRAANISSNNSTGGQPIADPSAILGGNDQQQQQQQQQRHNLSERFAQMLLDLDEPLPPMRPLPLDLDANSTSLTTSAAAAVAAAGGGYSTGGEQHGVIAS